MFYSQKLDVKTQINFCVKCEARFPQWSSYHAHITSNQCIKKIVPVRTSARTKAEIVTAFEQTIKGALIS